MDQKTITVANRSASIRVVVSMDGRPLQLDIDQGEYANGADMLAIRVLELCKLAGGRALALRRAELEILGFDGNMLARLGLPARAELEATEVAADLVEDGEPQSWLAHV
ncbi:hypothetical protein [Tomitella biformata]|uniref:hypothetical protein n=1 Tax=Tomitella biformata TaxID=630403 RepID=UPI000464436D|nr:hypothetical protein [Tomitella biformata]